MQDGSPRARAKAALDRRVAKEGVAPSGTGGAASGGHPLPPAARASEHRPPRALDRTRSHRLNLALQGGGAHGAFTWGVLDRLLQEPCLEIAAISGCSAGALNGAALKAGLVSGGREGARETLERLWERMGAIPDFSFTQWLMTFLPGPAMTAKMMEAVLPFPLFETLTNAVSPYDLPFLDNPLRRVVEGLAFDAVCAREGPALFVAATNVRTGKIRVFQGDEITTDAILASACLPTLFRAVEIADAATGATEAYWDGGYAGNPPLFPLFEPQLPADVVVVNINPLVREDVPRTPQEISNRVNEISFNSSLLRELRAIAFVKRLIAGGALAPGAMKDVSIHMIADDALMQSLSVLTKSIPQPALLRQLFTAGAAAAELFLERDAGYLGQEGTVDLAGMFG